MAGKVFEKLGLYGWQAQEPVMLSALVADIPVLMVGRHGGGKTRAAEAVGLSYLLGMGVEAHFQPFDWSRCSKEDFSGILNPAGLISGKLEWIPTPSSVWESKPGQRKCILLDEFTAANPVMGTMAHELLTHRTLFGSPTAVDVVMAACNPPDNYEVNVMSLATASRFVIVKCPDATEVAGDLEKILLGSDADFSTPRPIVGKLARAARKVKLDPERLKEIATTVKALHEALNSFKTDDEATVYHSSRQAKYLYRLLVAANQLNEAGYAIGPGDLVELVCSTTPELWPIVSAEICGHRVEVEAVIQRILSSIKLGIKPLSALSLTELVKGNKDNATAWAADALAKLDGQVAFDDLDQAITELVASRDDIRSDLFNKVFHATYEKWISDESVAIPEGTALSAEGIKTLIKELVNA